MSTTPSLTAPPIESLVAEIVATLAYAGTAYLADEQSEENGSLDAAQIAADLAGMAFDRIAPRLGPEERTALSGMVAELRMTYVRKRGR